MYDTKLKSIQNRFETLSHRTNSVIIFTFYCAVVPVFIITGIRGNPFSTGGLSNHQFFAYNSSIQLLLAAIGALFCFWAVKFTRKNNNPEKHEKPWIWLLMSVAFIWAAYDEMLEVHEKLSSIIEQSTVPIGSIMIGAYGIIAIICTIILLRSLLQVRKAAKFYILGFCLLLLSVVMDQVPHAEFSVVSSIIEELSEYIAGTSFAVAFFIYGINIYHQGLVNMIAKLDHTADDTSLNKSTASASTVT